ncbi:MAG: hypothetical protein IID36_10135 [Planctomycetes bacterium]|nr:hypothetical protein [Planctomycetota bacterium]
MAAQPPSGVVDARQPFEPGADPSDPSQRQGIGSPDEPIQITLDVSGATIDCFEVCESDSDPLLGGNSIATFNEGPGNTYWITLHHAIAPMSWTTIRYNNDAFVEYLAHPANVNVDAFSNANDVLALIDILNGAWDPEYGDYSTDIDHSGLVNANDVLRLIDLLNGAASFEPYNGLESPDNTCP